MSDGWAPEPEEDVAALEAIWGREASAAAAPQDRPTSPDPTPRSRRVGRLLLVAGVAGVAVAAVAIAVGVAVVGDGDGATGGRSARSPERVASTTLPPWEPGWTTEVTCPRLEVSAERRTTACPLATDDERVFVIEERDDPAAVGGDPVTTLSAIGVADGRHDWSAPFAEGARAVLRHPSTVLVVGRVATHALDPITGDVRWSAPGVPLAPLGRDHLLLDHLTTAADGGRTSTMTVVRADTGAATFSRSGASPSLHVHPCGAAGLVVVSEGGRLTAHDVVDGSPRWSVESPHHDAFDPVVCGTEVVLAVEAGGVLVARHVGTGVAAATVALAGPDDEGLARIVEVAGGTVVVAVSDRVEGFSADAGLTRLWQLDPGGGGREAVVAAAGEGVAVAVPGDRAGWFGPDGAAGPQVALLGRQEAVIEAERLVAWGADEVLVASATDLSRARRLPLEDVRRAAAGSAHVVVSTRDEVRLYPFDP